MFQRWVLFIIKIADLNIAIKNKYDYILKQCAEYICAEQNFDFEVSVTENDISNEHKAGGFDFDEGYLESICIYRAIAKELPKYNAFVLHSAAIEFDGNAYCFAAKSGTGKTTHIMLWKKLFGENVTIINGDKPIVRRINEEFFVFGTPWSGKENLGNNVSAPLKGICFLEQAPYNDISRFSQHDALNKLLPQIFLAADGNVINNTIFLVDKILEDTPMWNLKCNISEEAAILSYKTMCKKD
jgi:hypothetical protein